MKKFTKFFISILAVVALAIPVLCSACKSEEEEVKQPELVDYASQLKLDFTTSTKKQEVKVRLFIDGDTTHFDPVPNSEVTPNANIADFAETQGYIKARYLAVNTPESTGQIEEWGKKASKFTHDKLDTAQKIVVESDKDYWDIDSTGDRYLLWIWYIPEAGGDYRNLNVEILQEGLAFGSKTSSNRYATTAQAALTQAEENLLYVFSGKKDPDFYYGEAKVISLKELRCHVADYNSIKVRTEGTVVAEFGNSVFIEDYDAESGIYFGMPVYYGYNPGGALISLLSVGNRVSVVGTVNEFHGTYQISGLAALNEYVPDDPNNCKLLAEDQEASFVETDPTQIIDGKITVNFEKENEDGDVVNEPVELNYGEAVLGTSVTVSNLTVKSISVTSNGGNNDGALSIYCDLGGGKEITVRTEVLKDENNNTITKEKYLNKTLTVKGIIEKYIPDDSKPEVYYYQVKVYRVDFITILGEESN